MGAVFRFKQFSIHQDRCAMKVGTDGVLLGAWAPVSHQPASILDIGAGTGLVALMLAQRCGAELIDALEIDPDAFEQCVQNFEASPWPDRLYAYHAGLEEYLEEAPEYDLIVSNPPFYKELIRYGTEARSRARQQYSLPFSLLLEAGGKLLSKTGVFTVILPFREQTNFIAMARENDLHLFRACEVRGHAEAPVKRCLLAFSRKPVAEPKQESVVIEEARHRYTAAYKELTKEFYLRGE